jgi:hypothetical protein
MKKSKQQAGLVKRGKDLDASVRFEARVEKSQKRRKLEKKGRKAARRGRR